jgi:hypothetical protein
MHSAPFDRCAELAPASDIVDQPARQVSKQPIPMHAVLGTMQNAEGYVLSAVVQPSETAEHHLAQIREVLEAQKTAITEAILGLNGGQRCARCHGCARTGPVRLLAVHLQRPGRSSSFTLTTPQQWATGSCCTLLVATGRFLIINLYRLRKLVESLFGDTLATQCPAWSVCAWLFGGGKRLSLVAQESCA